MLWRCTWESLWMEHLKTHTTSQAWGRIIYNLQNLMKEQATEEDNEDDEERPPATEEK